MRHVALISGLLFVGTLSCCFNLRFVSNGATPKFCTPYNGSRNHYTFIADAFRIEPVFQFNSGINGFLFSCTVDKLNEHSRIHSAQFCWKFELGDFEDCVNVNQTFGAVKLGEVTFNVTFDGRVGFEATKCETSNKIRDLAGYYFCKLRNNYDRIESNKVEIHDFYPYIRKLKNSFLSSYNSVTERSFYDSHVFEFGKESGGENKDVSIWMVQFLQSRSFWRLCNLELVPCSSEGRLLNPNIDYIQFANMSILLFPHIYAHSKLFSLEHVYDGQVLIRYTIAGDPYNLGLLNRDFVPYTSPYTKVFLRMGRNEVVNYNLQAAFTGTIRSFFWNCDQFQLGLDFKRSLHILQFPEEIEIRHGATYTLSVTSRKYPQGYNFVFRVIVLSPPRVPTEFPVPLRMYKMVQEPINIRVRFRGKYLIVTRSINEVPFFDGNNVDTIKKKFAYLRKYDFQYTPAAVYADDDVIVGFVIYNVQPLIQTRNQFLALGFQADNPLGSAHFRTFIEVVQRPVWKRTLHSGDTFCSTKMDCVFRCEISEEEYVRNGFRMVYTWTVGNQLYDSNLRDKRWNSSLVLGHNDASLIQVNGTIQMSCRLRIWSPTYLANNTTEYQELYDSDKDLGVRMDLRTKVSVIGVVHEDETHRRGLIYFSGVCFFFTLVGLCSLGFVLIKRKCKIRNKFSEESPDSADSTNVYSIELREVRFITSSSICPILPEICLEEDIVDNK